MVRRVYTVFMSEKVPIARHVIFVIVNLDANGRATYVPVEYQSNKDATLCTVRLGDQVAWMIRVGTNRAVPYRLTFSDPSLFGVSSLDVPAGGFSNYLSVRQFSSDRKYKYSVIVEGIFPTCDPEMQVEKDESVSSFGPQHTLTWDLKTQAITDAAGDSASHTTIDIGDQVQWKVNPPTSSQMNNNFKITFDPGNLSQLNPFDGYDQYQIIESQNSENEMGEPETGTSKLTVEDVGPAEQTFYYTLEGVKNGQVLPGLSITVKLAARPTEHGTPATA